MQTSTLTLRDKTIYLPYNPNTSYWDYELNRQVIDTYGGRVVQLLSVKTSSMSIEGESGTRARLLKLYSDLKELQDLQTQLQSPAHLVIPVSFAENGKIDQWVWVRDMQVSINVESVTYPYKLTLEIQEQGSKQVGDIIKDIAQKFQHFSPNIGYTHSGYYQGLDLSGRIPIAQISQFLYNGASKQEEWVPKYVVPSGGYYNVNQ